MKSEIIDAIKALSKEKNISENLLFSAIENAMEKAYQKNLGKDEIMPSSIVARVSRDDGSCKIYARMLVVEEVDNPAAQISLENALQVNPSAQMDDIVEVDVTPKNFLRVAAQAAKQVIVQKIREAERGKVYDEFSEKKDEIMTAVVQRMDANNIYVDLSHTDGVLPVSELIPGEEVHEGDHLKVYVLEVSKATAGIRGPQVHVSRIHPSLVKRLFELEVPEIAGGIVTIKSLAREAGSRTKMAVYSADMMVDPVGSCVGQRGGRVDRVVQELKGEKIDIIKWSEDPAEFIANALNPAHVNSVYVADGVHSCRVVVPDNQLSLAIGKEGQNARLAAKLTGWKIDIKSESQAMEMSDMQEADDMPAVTSMTMEYDSSLEPADDDTL